MAKFIVCSKDKHDNEKNRPVNLDLVTTILPLQISQKVYSIRFDFGQTQTAWYYDDKETRDKDYNKIIGKPIIKVGDTVKVIDNTSDHEFDLGELVVVIDIGDNYRCKGERGDRWYLEINELELI